MMTSYENKLTAYQQGLKDAHIWTPISYGLPAVGVPVLVTMETGRIEIASLDVNRVTWTGQARSMVLNSVIAWQKLPEPYDPGIADEGEEYDG